MAGPPKTGFLSFRDVINACLWWLGWWGKQSPESMAAPRIWCASYIQCISYTIHVHSYTIEILQHDIWYTWYTLAHYTINWYYKIYENELMTISMGKSPELWAWHMWTRNSWKDATGLFHRGRDYLEAPHIRLKGFLSLMRICLIVICFVSHTEEVTEDGQNYCDRDIMTGKTKKNNTHTHTLMWGQLWLYLLTFTLWCRQAL